MSILLLSKLCKTYYRSYCQEMFYCIKSFRKCIVNPPPPPLQQDPPCYRHHPCHTSEKTFLSWYVSFPSGNVLTPHFRFQWTVCATRPCATVTRAVCVRGTTTCVSVSAGTGAMGGDVFVSFTSYFKFIFGRSVEDFADDVLSQ